MNIALCHESVLPRKGGCETYIAGLARRLVADGHQVHLYAWRWDAPALPAGLRCHAVELPTRPRLLRPWLFSRACRQRLAIGGHDVSLGFDKVAGVDVYYPQGGVYTEAIARSMGKHGWPVLRRTLAALRWLDPAHASFAALERAQYRHPGSLVIAISDLVRRQFLALPGMTEARIRLLPIATPPERFREDDRQGRRLRFRERHGLAVDHVVALFAGMNYRLKGLEPLLHALTRLPRGGLYLAVAGKPAAGPFARLARRLGVEEQVRFIGYCPDMRDAYFAADLLAHPTFYDPCANVVLEALACGLPVLTSRHNGAGELMHREGPDGTCAEGYVIDDPHDHARLATCLERLLDAGRRRRCAEAARRTAEGWTFEDHYRDCSASWPRRPGGGCARRAEVAADLRPAP